MISFNRLLRERIKRLNTNLCVGIDISPEGLGTATDDLKALKDHAKLVVDATRHVAVAYKPNLAFFERFGAAGFEWLAEITEYIGTETLVIGDAKRGDIGNTAVQYASSAFNYFKFDAITVNPYMGEDAIKPFTEYQDKGVFVLCRTSNPGALEIQNGGERPVYAAVADMVVRLNYADNLGLVVGATGTAEMKSIRDRAPGIPFLIPGIGAQGGDLESSMRIGNTGAVALVSISRSIIYAGNRTVKDIKEAAESFAVEMRNIGDEWRYN